MPSLRARSWSGWAWGAIAVVAAFIAITCWWLSRDRGVPFGDAASHLNTVVAYHDLLRDGDLGGLLHRSGFYPPATFVTGAVATLVGGLDASTAVIGENLVYVSLLALGCYGTGRLAGGPAAGFLAVVFALGCPLLIEQLHVFMLDAPEAALVALAVWLILASERFARPGTAAAAGVAVGLGMASKEQFPLYVIGLLVVVLAREGGWRNRRGILLFAVCAVVVAAPWYVANLSQLGTYASSGLGNANLPEQARPALLSLSNAGWYLWAIMNGLLFAPLLAFAVAGVAQAVAGVARGRTTAAPASPPLGGLAPELLAGLFGGWLGLTLTPHHDMRYAMGLVVYLAVLGTAWIVPLRRPWGAALAGALALAVVATTLGASFGVGGQLRIVLPGGPVATDASVGVPPRSQLTLYADRDYQLSAPRRADDVPRLFAAMARDGITGVAWDPEQAPSGDVVADSQGLLAVARFEGLAGPQVGLTRFTTRAPTRASGTDWNVADPDHAFLIRTRTLTGGTACVALSDGSVLRLVRGNPYDGTGRPYCPL